MAVSLTVTLTLGAVGVGLGTFAWQCQTACQHLPWPLSAMFVQTSPGWRVLWGSLIPLLVLAVLAVLSWRKSVQYDLIRPPEMGRINPDRRNGHTRRTQARDPSSGMGDTRSAGSGICICRPGGGSGCLVYSTRRRAMGIGLAALSVVLLGGLAWHGLALLVYWFSYVLHVGTAGARSSDRARDPDAAHAVHGNRGPGSDHAPDRGDTRRHRRSESSNWWSMLSTSGSAGSRARRPNV